MKQTNRPRVLIALSVMTVVAGVLAVQAQTQPSATQHSATTAPSVLPSTAGGTREERDGSGGRRNRRNGGFDRSERGGSERTVAATTGPASTQGSAFVLVNTTPPPLPSDFYVMTERSIFSRTRPVRRGEETQAPRTQASMVFNGVVDVDGVPVAFVEDTTQGRVVRVKEGEAVFKGKVTRISLDSLDYEVDGKKVTVAVGQSLEGGDAPPVGERAIAPPSQPAGPVNEVVERMRQARLKAMGGGE